MRTVCRACAPCLSQERKRERLKRKTAELTTAERNLVCILSNQAGTTLQPADVAMLHGIEEKEEAKLDAEEAQLAVEEASLAASSLPVGPLREAAEEVLHARRRALDAERGVLEAETEEEKRAAQVQGRDAADYEQAAKQLRAVVRRKHSL